MSNGTEQGATVAWHELRRTSSHRTSSVTDKALRSAIGVATARRGAAPRVDTMIYLGVQLIERLQKSKPQEIDAMLFAIERGQYPAPRGPVEPGE